MTYDQGVWAWIEESVEPVWVVVWGARERIGEGGGGFGGRGEVIVGAMKIVVGLEELAWWILSPGSICCCMWGFAW